MYKLITKYNKNVINLKKNYLSTENITSNIKKILSLTCEPVIYISDGDV